MTQMGAGVCPPGEGVPTSSLALATLSTTVLIPLACQTPAQTHQLSPRVLPIQFSRPGKGHILLLVGTQNLHFVPATVFNPHPSPLKGQLLPASSHFSTQPGPSTLIYGRRGGHGFPWLIRSLGKGGVSN